jgi:hypothetical protein
MARKLRVLTEHEIDKAAAMYGVGANLEQIAHVLNITPVTLDRILVRQPEVKDALEKGRASAAGNVMKTAYQMAVSGKIPAMTIFWLKTRLRWTEPREPREEDNQPTEFTLNYKP